MNDDQLGLVGRLRAPSMTDTTATHIDRMRMAADEIDRLREELALCCELKREYQEQAAAERERWATVVRRMHEADDAYGTGFYNEDKWRTAYNELRAMCGMESRS